MATTTVSGSTVTFSNSGAAANITQTAAEDASLSFVFDVLALSGGGVVGMALLPSGRAIVTTSGALFALDWDVRGLPLLG